MVSPLSSPTWPASLPAAPTLPGLGPWINTIDYAKDSLGFAGRLFQQHGPIVSLAARGGTNFYSPLLDCPGTVIACGPEVVKQVALNHDIFHKFPLTGVLHRYRNRSDRTTGLHHFGVGLFGINGLQHLQHRRLMMPAFHQRQIEAYRDDMVAITAEMLDRVPLHQPFDVATLMRLLTLRVATKTLFGYDLDESGGELGQLLQQILSMLGSLGVLMLPYDRPGLPFHRFLNRIHDYERAMDRLIVQKRQQAGQAHDMLALLLQARDAETGLTLSQAELLGHTGVLFAAGHENQRQCTDLDPDATVSTSPGGEQVALRTDRRAAGDCPHPRPAKANALFGCSGQRVFANHYPRSLEWSGAGSIHPGAGL